jgi:hypothetical protein
MEWNVHRDQQGSSGALPAYPPHRPLASSPPNAEEHFTREINMSVSGILSSGVSQKFSSLNSPPTIREDSHIQLAVKLGSLTVRMKAIDQVLVQKELELARVGKELDALRIVAPLLRGEKDGLSETVETTQTPNVMQASVAPDESVLDLQSVFSAWRKRWLEATNRLLAVAAIRRHS